MVDEIFNEVFEEVGKVHLIIVVNDNEVEDPKNNIGVNN